MYLKRSRIEVEHTDGVNRSHEAFLLVHMLVRLLDFLLVLFRAVQAGVASRAAAEGCIFGVSCRADVAVPAGNCEL